MNQVWTSCCLIISGEVSYTCQDSCGTMSLGITDPALLPPSPVRVSGLLNLRSDRVYGDCVISLATATTSILAVL